MSSLSERFLELDDLTDGVLDAAADGGSDPIALTFLLRRYRATGRDDLTEMLGAALARAVETARGATTCDARSRWLEAFVIAATLSSDARMQTAIAELVAALRSEWRLTDSVADLVTSIDACLQATTVFESADLVRDAIDELERVVAHAYRPGRGIAATIDGADTADRRFADQMRGASALVTACVGTSRLPYGMLAEELIQFARRTFWDADAGAFTVQSGGPLPPDAASARDAFAANCDAVRVLCRFARLLKEDDYRLGAVLAETNGGADYLDDASRILASQVAAARGTAAGAAAYALALDDWLSLR